MADGQQSEAIGQVEILTSKNEYSCEYSGFQKAIKWISFWITQIEKDIPAQEEMKMNI